MLKKWNAVPVAVKASAVYAVCSILQKCLSFLTMPLFTRLMTTAQYGQYMVYTSWSSIFTIFITLYLAFGCFNTAMVRFEEDSDRYIAAIQGICTALAVVFLAIYLPFRNFFNKLFELPTALVLLMVAEIVMTFSLSCWYGKLRFSFRYKPVAAVTLLIAVLSPLLAYFLVTASPEKGYARIFGYGLVVVAFGGAIYIRNLLRGKSFFHKKYWRYALSFNVPLIPYYLSQVVFNQSDRIMISHFSGQDKAGIYGVACTLALVLNFVLNAINDAYVPWLYRNLKIKNTSDSPKVANIIGVLMAVLLLGVIGLAPELIHLLAGEQYREAVWAVGPVAVSVLLLFYSQLFINIQFYYEQKGMLVFASLGAAVLNIVLNALMIPRFGFLAAAYTTLVSYLVFAGANFWAMRQTLKKQAIQEKLFDMRGLSLILLAFVVLSAAAMALYDYLVIRLAIAAVFVIVLAFRFRDIGQLLRTFRGNPDT